MGIRRHIPNLLTLGNLFCGCLSIYTLNTADGNPVLKIALFLAASLILDFLDGMVARLLGVKSDIGKELDSLADVVSFGVVPGMMMHRMMAISTDGSVAYANWFPFIAFLIPMLSALRLAKFNLDTRQTDSFIGLPTPANTILIFSIFAAASEAIPGTRSYAIFFHPVFQTVVTVLTAWLLVAEIPLFSLKVKGFALRTNWYRYTLLLFSLLLYVLWGNIGLVFLIPSYILLSLILNISSR